jgi:serine/threonine-protein kinase
MASTPGDPLRKTDPSRSEAGSEKPTVTLSQESAAQAPGGSGRVEFSPGELMAGRFRIARELGRGGMGVVYEAIDEKLTRRVAVKCAPAKYASYLTPEVRNASAVSHRNVCRIFEIHTAATRFGAVDFITMEYLEGETLSSRLRKGPPPKREARTIARQLAEGLAEAHRHHVIHGDIKSNNIILTTGIDGAVRAVITDFGLAQAPGTQARTGCGTPGYMAPELWKGEAISERSDIYALGVVLFELASGQRPWQIPGNTEMAPIDWAGVANRLPPAAGPSWDRILERCLDPNPARRFRDANELAKALAPSQAARRSLAIASAIALAAITGFIAYRNATAPADTVKLALLPFSVEGAPVPSAAGIGEDIAAQLSGARRQFTVYSPSDLRRRGALSPENARSALGATHALRVGLNSAGSRIHMNAAVIDLASGRSIRELNADYSPQDEWIMAQALLGTVTGAFHINRSAPKNGVPAEAYPYYVQGAELLRADSMHPDPALPLLEKAVALAPHSTDVLSQLAAAQVDKFLTGGGKEWLTRAEQTVADAQRINPDSFPVLLAAGLVDEQRGSYERAIQAYSRATELSPNNTAAWRQLAVAYGNSNHSEEAIAAYRKAIEADPGYYRPYLDFGNFYLYRADFRQAEQEYRRVVSLAPQLPAGYINLGLALMDQGKLAEAETSLLRAVSLRATPEALMNLGVVYYQERKFADSARSLEASLQSGAPSALQYSDLGDALRQLGQAGKSRSAYRRALSLAESEVAGNPRAAFSRALLGWIAARTGDPRRAESEAVQALAMEPENAAVIRESVLLFDAIGNRTRALELLRTAPLHLLRDLQRDPDIPDLQRDRRFIELLAAPGN